ncbi:hypothetical protein OAD57_09230 [Porticoccaceae bacterium]|nr:hypothetical protein [Porticoccaceae bacterium]
MLGRINQPICLKITVDVFSNCKRAFNRFHIWKPEKWTDEVKPCMAKQASLRSMKEKNSAKHLTVEVIDSMGEKDGAFLEFKIIMVGYMINYKKLKMEQQRNSIVNCHCDVFSLNKIEHNYRGKYYDI